VQRHWSAWFSKVFAISAVLVAAPEAEAPLSSPRQALADALAAVGEAQGNFEEADRPVQALQKVIAAVIRPGASRAGVGRRGLHVDEDRGALASLGYRG
jgi:hypothetical protein